MSIEKAQLNNMSNEEFVRYAARFPTALVAESGVHRIAKLLEELEARSNTLELEAQLSNCEEELRDTEVERDDLADKCSSLEKDISDRDVHIRELERQIRELHGR